MNVIVLLDYFDLLREIIFVNEYFSVKKDKVLELNWGIRGCRWFGGSILVFL